MDDLILVTGAAGFIGSNVARMLAEDGARVVACDWFEHGAKWTNLQGVLLHDVIRPEAAPAWLKAQAEPPSAIVHMGAVSATTETDVDLIVDRNIRATLDLWTYAAEHGSRLIYASSAATYGDGSQGFVDDDSPGALARLKPLNAYGWSKHVVDRRVADDVRRGRPTPAGWAGLKFFNVYGPAEAHKGAMRSVVHQIYPAASRGETISLFKSHHLDYADGGQLRDFIYVADCCAVIRNMLRAPQLSGIYNVGTGKARSFADLARAVFAAADQPAAIAYRDMPEALRGRYQYFTEADTAKLQAAGLAPNFHSLEDGVAAYVRDSLSAEFAVI
ncbi:ADP-glyceromanno-heptose 6-epimerase [Caulobacter sp. S45]|uniref:ADP-glyceromanno-heptose 6-epimerase n=1 Tax=Caulobacter sp. S45 TaxID=1641861 RepID=UPI0015762DFA|nr:ADP-glyceromanno-heptose 6-epimerase [Caulobacter sp. S45]